MGVEFVVEVETPIGWLGQWGPPGHRVLNLLLEWKRRSIGWDMGRPGHRGQSGHGKIF